MTTSDVAVLVVSYNVREALCRALASIPKEAHAVVVDNASSDGTVAHVRAHFPHVTVSAQADNLGFSQAINRAARLTQAPYLLLLNPDAWLMPHTLPALKRSLDAHHAHSGAWAVGPRQVDDDNRLQLSVGPKPTFLGEACRRLVQRRLDQPGSLGAALTRSALDHWGHKPRQVPWVAGSAIMIRREHFERIGGFDPHFFLYFEDIDFCLRIARAGGSVIYDPTITVGHSRGVSAHGAQSLAQRAYRDSQQYFASRHQGRVLAPLMRAWAAYRRGAP